MVGKFRRCLIGGLLALVGCGIPLGRKSINSELYENTKEFGDKVFLLKNDMTETQVFNILNITSDTPNLNVISTENIQALVYGRSEVRGTPQEVEVFKSRLALFKGYALPYTLIHRSGSLGFFSWSELKKGYDQRLVLVFDNGKLIKALLEGRRSVEEEDTSYLWDVLWDVVQGSAKEGGRNAVKSAVPIP